MNGQLLYWRLEVRSRKNVNLVIAMVRHIIRAPATFSQLRYVPPLTFWRLNILAQCSETATTHLVFILLDQPDITPTTTNESLESVGRNIFDTNPVALANDTTGTQLRAFVTNPDENVTNKAIDD